MEFLGKHRLVPHPQFPPSGQLGVSVDAAIVEGPTLSLVYHVSSAKTLRLPVRPAGRQEELWKSSCFEMFLRPKSGGYTEFNFSPDSAWDAYQFTDWRKGRAQLPMQASPHLVDSRVDGKPTCGAEYSLDVLLDVSLLPQGGGKASFAAVIDELDGTKSYWALRHPPGDTPNFHHPDCFVIQIPAAGAA